MQHVRVKENRGCPLNDSVRADDPAVPAERRLAAILHADVAGYSRLMGADEAGTHARLMAARQVIGGQAAAHGGRVAGTAGDAVLAVFDSVVGALSAAIGIQTALAETNAPLPADQRLVFRIGLNIGDVIADRGDVFGAGVNVAARVEALADPGGIAVSAAVRDQVGTRLAVRFVDRGAHRLKNIDEPVHVFAVVSGAAVPLGRAHRRRLALAAGLAAVMAVGIGSLAVPRLIGPAPLGPGSPASDIRPAAATPPVIAVLPFALRDEAVDEVYFADGVTEDVIGALGRFSGLVVLSYSAVASFRDRAPTPAEIKSALGADYVVSGSIQRGGTRIRVSVQLSKASNGALVWSDRYDEDLADIFAVQDRITRHVVAALTVRVTEIEKARALAAPTESLGAYDSVLRGREAMRLVGLSGNVRARALFERALQLDPDYADALVEIGWTQLDDMKYGWTQWPERALEAAAKAADRAITLDPLNAAAHALQADVLSFQDDIEGARRAVDRALELNPNSAVAHVIRADLMVVLGEPDEAIGHMETALQLDPHPRAGWLMPLLAAYYVTGRYAEVRALNRRYPRETGEEPGHLAMIAAALAMLGDDTAARATADKVRRGAPFFRAADFAALYGTAEHQAVVLEGLHRAGLD